MASPAADQRGDTSVETNPFLRAAQGHYTADTPVGANPLLAPASTGAESTFLVSDHGAQSPERQRVDGDPFLASSAHSGVAALESVAGNDPFLTHSAQPDRRQEIVRDPFLTQSAEHAPAAAAPHGRAMEKVSRDPFLVGKNPPPPLPDEGRVHHCVRKTTQGIVGAGTYCFGCMGRRCETAPSIVQHVEAEVVLWPWLTLLVVLVLQIVMRQGFMWVGPIVALSLLVAIFTSARTVPSIRRMELRLALAVLVGYFLGRWAYHEFARQYWWMHDGVQYDTPTVLSDMPALSRADAAWIRFKVQDDSAEVDEPTDVRVDVTRSAGYRNDNIWCVAPILSEDFVDDLGYVRVEYWAVGIDCCSSMGSFQCDDARERTGQYGVPLVGGWTGKYAFAAEKAEALYGMFRSEGALPVRFVDDPKDWRAELGQNLFAIVAWAALVGFVAFYGMALCDSAMAAVLPEYWEHPGLPAPAGLQAEKESHRRTFTNHFLLGVAIVFAVGVMMVVALALDMIGTAIALAVVLVLLVFLLATSGAASKDAKLVAVEKAGGGPGFVGTLEAGGYGVASDPSLGAPPASDFVLTRSLHAALH